MEEVVQLLLTYWLVVLDDVKPRRNFNIFVIKNRGEKGVDDPKYFVFGTNFELWISCILGWDEYFGGVRS